MQTPEKHECVFGEEKEPSGRLIVTPCLQCGYSAMDAMKDLKNRISTFEEVAKHDAKVIRETWDRVEEAWHEGFKKGQITNDQSIHGMSIEKDGKRIDPKDVFKTSEDFFRDGWNSAIAKASEVADSFKFLSDCNCDRHKRIASEISKLARGK